MGERVLEGAQHRESRGPEGEGFAPGRRLLTSILEVREGTQVDLKAALPHLLPKAISWAEAEATRGAHAGRELSERERDLARKVGVTHPDRIRLISVDALPMPTDPTLRAAAEQTGFLDPGMLGLTLGHSVFICHGHETARLLSHEFRHVYQYEQAGSIADFLPEFLFQIVERGYAATTFEADARAHERTDL